MRLPNPTWKQPNNSDKFGNVWRTKNINFDYEGYAKLSPRLVRLYSDNEDGDFNLPLAIGRQGIGSYQIATAEANYVATVQTGEKTFNENTGTDNPNASTDGDGVWYQGAWHVATDTTVVSRVAGASGSTDWDERITGLTDNVRHVLEVFKSRVSLCVSNKNVVKQYDSTYTGTTDLTLPADFEVSGMAYNADRMGIITRPYNDGTTGQDQEAQFFSWNGSTTGAVGYGLGSDAGIGICAYQSSFLVLTRNGQLLYWNGGGFQVVASFPFYFTEQIYGDALSNTALGAVHMEVVGDTVLIHIGNELGKFTRREDNVLHEFPAGVWCFDPNVGLYHKYSLSNSPAYIFAVTSGNVNTTTDVLTISSGTVPATGNIARLVTNSGITGLTENEDYYIIKVTDTTMQLATTRENALVGIAIDITASTGSTNYFWVVNHKDYGTVLYNYPGAIKQAGDAVNNYAVFTDIVAGARIQDTDLTPLNVACIAVPWLENKGLIELPKLFSSSEKDTPQSIGIRFRPLNSVSKIVVYGRNRDIYGLPTTTSGNDATWADDSSVYVTKDLSDAKTYIDNGGSLLMEITAGVGAGEHVLVEGIYTADNLTYQVVLKEKIFGVVAQDKCEFTLLNYEKLSTITHEDNDEGYKDVSIDMSGAKFSQFLIELVGYDIIIEDISYENETLE